jgi:fumarylpyruvate hydrolase
MNFLFDPAPVKAVQMADGSGFYPVRRVYCVGRNYLAHAREMGADEREAPFFFSKFADTVISSGCIIAYPPRTSDFHYEGELVIAIGTTAQNIAVEDALSAIFGYACGLDMTRRDLQLIARDKGRPWDMGKNFSEAAIVAPIVRADAFGHDVEGKMLRLTVNGETKQETDLELLIWSCAEIVAELSCCDTLEPGDLIFTGTPAGVGPVVAGDEMVLTIDGLPTLTAKVAQ